MVHSVIFMYVLLKRTWYLELLSSLRLVVLVMLVVLADIRCLGGISSTSTSITSARNDVCVDRQNLIRIRCHPTFQSEAGPETTGCAISQRKHSEKINIHKMKA